MAIHTMRAVPRNGTTNMSTQAAESVNADSSSHGLALPASARVCSINCPTTRLAITMSTVDTSCNRVRNFRSSRSTSVK